MKHLVKNSGSYRIDGFFSLEHSCTPVFLSRTSAGKARRLWGRIFASSRGRVVKATDSKSVSLWERRFESCRLRNTIRWRLSFRFFSQEKWSSAAYVTTGESAFYAGHCWLTKAKKLVDLFRSLKLNSWQCTVQLSLIFVSISRVKNTITR